MNVQIGAMRAAMEVTRMMDINQATREYEVWLKEGLPAFDQYALDYKHVAMKDKPAKNGGSAFPFLRATFYRWAQRWLKEAGDLGKAPPVLAVGDLHIENFGTWRDPDCHLIWGVNDFDEAFRLPWTSDLVRLGVSASLVVRRDDLGLKTSTVCELILEGYEERLTEGQIVAFNLDEGYNRLRAMIQSAFKSAEKFWEPFDDPDSKWQPVQVPPPGAREALHAALPRDARVVKKGYRVQQGEYDEDRKPAGLGSLGRPRYCVIAEWKGKRLVREVKALLPSAVIWAAKSKDRQIRLGPLLTEARPCPDPWMTLHDGWIARRISPKGVKVSIEDLEKDGFEVEDAEKLFRSMGRETANIHLASAKADRLLEDLQARSEEDPEWFFAAVKDWRGKVEEDWNEFDPGEV